MSISNNPPSEYFSGIYYNPTFFSTNNGISLAFGTANYLSRIGTATSVATSTTFSGSVTGNGGLVVTGGETVDTLNATTSLSVGGTDISTIYAKLASANIFTGTNDFKGSVNQFDGSYTGSQSFGVYSRSGLYGTLMIWANLGTGITQRYTFCDESVVGSPQFAVVDWISPANSNASNILRNGWLWKANNVYTTAMSLSKTGNLTAIGTVTGGNISTVGTVTGGNITTAGTVTGTTAVVGGTINSINIIANAYNGLSMGVTCIPTSATGLYNFCMGISSLYSLTGGDNNVAVGAFSGIGITSSSNNTAIGSNALRGGNVINSTAIGANALYNSTGTDNIGIGVNALNASIAGSGNTCIGTNSNSTGNPTNCTAIGRNSTCASFSQSCAIGYNATANANNQIMLGTSGDTVQCPNRIKVRDTSTVGGIQFGTFSTSSSSGVTVYFPVAFVNVPIVVATVIYGGTGYATGNIFITSTATSYFTYNFQFSGGFPSAQYVSINWIAICS